jgi:diacylglycerol O-acyltransferase
MPALSTIDLAMFMLESRERPFNIGPLILLRPPKGYRGNFANRLYDKLLERPVGAPFNYKLKLSLTSLPALVPVKNPDVAAHVHRLTLPKASTDELLAKICKLHESPLDRSGMLWQFYVIDGLADGRVALYGKVHHGIIDGRTFVKAMTQCISTDPGDMKVRAMWEGVARSGARDEAQLGIAARLMSAGAQAVGAVRSAAEISGMLANQSLGSLGILDTIPLPFTKVSSALDGKITAERSFAFCNLPLAEMKAIGKENSATVNDMLLTALDIALHRYLGKHAQPHDEPLVADMPLALKSGAKGSNEITVLQLPLGRAASSVEDRLAAIHRESLRVKDMLKKKRSDTLMLYTTLVHALPMVMEAFGSKMAPQLSNLLVSNPFGFEGQAYLMGATVEQALPVSVVVAGQKLNVTAVTLGKRLQVGFLAMPDAVPMISELARLTEKAFEEIRSALNPVDGWTPPVTKPRARRAKKVVPEPIAKPAAKRSAKAVAPESAPVKPARQRRAPAKPSAVKAAVKKATPARKPRGSSKS